MTSYVNKRLFQGLICLHILHHADDSPVYGSWLLEELAKHGYALSPGTLYPMLHHMESEGLIKHSDENVGGKIRKYYTTTDTGKEELEEAKQYLSELVYEIGIKEKNDV